MPCEVVISTDIYQFDIIESSLAPGTKACVSGRYDHKQQKITPPHQHGDIIPYRVSVEGALIIVYLFMF